MTNLQRSLQLEVDRPAQKHTPAAADHALTLGEIARRLSAHWMFIAVCALVCVVLSAAYVAFKPPVYEASALLRLDPGTAGSLGLSEVTGPAQGEPSELIHTEVVILKSDGVIIRALNALSDDEFFAYTGSHRDGNLLPEAVEDLSPAQQKLINRLQRELTVKQIEGTQLVSVAFTDRQPRVAAAVDNAVMRAYELQTFANRDHSVSQVRTWLSAQMNDLKNQVEVAQKKLSNFEEANHFVATAGTSNTIMDRLRLLNEALSTAQSERILKEARMRSAVAGGSSELASLFPNPKLTTLQTAQGTAYAQYAQMSSKFGSSYPPLGDLKKQIQELDAQISGEVESARNRLRQEYQASQRAQEMLQGEYNTQTQLAYDFSRNQAEYTALQADVTTSRDLYDTLRRKLQQARVDTQVSGLNTTLVQSARVPTQPAGPRKALILLGGLILGLLAGMAAAFLREATSDRIQSINQIERGLGIPVLALLSKSASVSQAPVAFKLGSAGSLARSTAAEVQELEPIRALRNSVYLSPGVKVVLLAGSVAGDDAIAAAAKLAVVIAQSGARVLLVDGNIADPKLHRYFGVENGIGLGDYLAQSTSEPKTIQPLPDQGGLLFLSGGDGTSLTPDALASSKFHTVLLAWRRNFDYVIVTSPPLLVANASILLANWVDATLLVTRYGDSRLADLIKVRDTLSRNDSNILGVVLSDVPAREARSSNLGQSEKANDAYPVFTQTSRIAG